LNFKKFQNTVENKYTLEKILETIPNNIIDKVEFKGLSTENLK